jgi:hypothetical protein
MLLLPKAPFRSYICNQTCPRTPWRVSRDLALCLPCDDKVACVTMAGWRLESLQAENVRFLQEEQMDLDDSIKGKKPLERAMSFFF